MSRDTLVSKCFYCCILILCCIYFSSYFIFALLNQIGNNTTKISITTNLTSVTKNPAVEDAKEEEENNLDLEIIDGGHREDASSEVHLNNNFCFVEEDFIASRTVVNDATSH